MRRRDDLLRYGTSVAAILIPFVAACVLNSCGPSKEAAVVPPAAKKAMTSTVKILTLNARHTLKDRSDVRKLARIIKSHGVEILAVQQVERPEEGNDGFDAVKELGKELDMYNFFGKARYFEGVSSGNAVLSMYPVRQTIVQDLPVAKGKVRRSIAFGSVDVGLRNVDVASTELDDESSSERVSEVEEIFSFAKPYAGELFVVCGDFNEPMSGKASARMGEHFTVANALEKSTENTDQRLYVINDPKIRPLSIEKLRFGNSVEGLLVTIEVTQ
ncbi:MAG TPA: endonuclease/exonuclease/phosphatase family protein [Bacteroidota bacterium]|nr:endonuclease/exonuclease/phosphatase family protein [Bacteroidota bacterium]